MCQLDFVFVFFVHYKDRIGELCEKSEKKPNPVVVLVVYRFI